MTAQINPNIITNINNPFTGKILFYTKKSTANIWHENVELLYYAKHLLRFFKLKKHLPSEGLKIKRTSLNNVYIFNFLPKHSRQPNKMLKTLVSLRNNLQKLGGRRLEQASSRKGFRTRKSKKRIKNKKHAFHLLEKRLKSIKNAHKKHNIETTFHTQVVIPKRKYQIVPSLIKNGLFFKSVNNVRKDLLCLRRKKYLKSSLFTAIKKITIRKFSEKISRKSLNFNFSKKNVEKFQDWLISKILKQLALKHVKSLNQEGLLNNFSKKFNYSRNLRSYRGLFFKNALKTKIKKAFYDKTKSKFYKRSNKYRSDLRSFSYMNIIKNSFLNPTNEKQNAFFYKKTLKTNNRFNVLSKQFRNFQKEKNDQHVVAGNFLLLQNNSSFLKNNSISKIFLYQLLIRNRLQLEDKIAFFENECSFTFNILFSNFKLVYQKFLNLMPKVTETFSTFINEEDLPATRKNYSKLYVSLSESIRTQNFGYVQNCLNRFLRRQNTRRLYQASNDIVQAVEKILHEQFFWNLYLFTTYRNKKSETFLDFLFSKPFDITLKVPYTFILKYRGKLKKAGRKQRSNFFYKNALISENLNIFKALDISIKKLKYETISSRFATHFKRGGTGGFNLSVTYVYP